jgi:hypothetical protein
MNTTFGYQYTRPQQRKLNLLKRRDERKVGCTKAYYNKTKELITSEIPNVVPEIIKERYTKGQMYLAAVIIIISLTIFVINLTNQYDIAKNTSYMSVDKASGNCKDVPRSNTFTMLFDFNGNWRSNSKWGPSISFWYNDVTGLEATQANYDTFVDMFTYEVNKSKVKAQNWSLADIYIWGISFFVYSNSNNVGGALGDTFSAILSMNVKPDIIFTGASNYNAYLFRNNNKSATQKCYDYFKPAVTVQNSIATFAFPVPFTTPASGDLYNFFQCNKILNPASFIIFPSNFRKASKLINGTDIHIANVPNEANDINTINIDQIKYNIGK